MVINSLHEIKHGRNRSTGRRELLSFATFAHVCRVISTFTSLCLLWSMWSSDSFEQWVLMWRAAGVSSAAIVAIIPVFHLLANWAEKRAAAAPQDKSKSKLATPAAAAAGRMAQPQPAGATAFASVAIVALAGLILASWPGQPLISGEIAEIAQRTRSEHLNRRDQNQMERGYYEHLINVNRNSAGLWDQLEEKPANWDNLDDTAAAVHPGTFILTELAPNSSTVFKNRPLVTNRWGMRDQDYEKAKPPNTTRLAFMGSSHVMGSGVENNQVFEQLLEQRLNAGKSPTQQHYEVLNFGMAAYSALQQLYALDHKVADFKPDVIVYVQMEEDERFILRHLSMAIRGGIDIPYDYVKKIVNDQKLTAASSDELIRQKLTPYANQIEDWAEHALVARISELGMEPVCVMLPRVQARPNREATAKRQRVALESGCNAISLVDVYDGYNERDLQLADWDQHPNPLGHELIATRLYKELQTHPDLLRVAQRD